MVDYEKDSVFLPALNGELPNSLRDLKDAKDRFTKINAIMLVMFSEDTMIHPKETAWFGSLDKNGNPVTMKEQ